MQILALLPKASTLQEPTMETKEPKLRTRKRSMAMRNRQSHLRRKKQDQARRLRKFKAMCKANDVRLLPPIDDDQEKVVRAFTSITALTADQINNHIEQESFDSTIKAAMFDNSAMAHI